MSTTPTYAKSIAYDRETRDYACYLGGELVGYASTYHEAEVALDELVSELLSGQYAADLSPADVAEIQRETEATTADMLADVAAEASTEEGLLVAPVEQLPVGWMRMPEGDILDADGMRVSLPDLDGPVVAAIVHGGLCCRACQGQHHIQHCPEIRKLLYAPITARAIERALQTSNILRAVELGIITPEQLAEHAA